MHLPKTLLLHPAHRAQALSGRSRGTPVSRLRILGLLATAALGLLLTGCGQPSQPAAAAGKKKLVLLLAENEYRSEVTLPVFAREHLAKEFEVSIVDGTPDENRHTIPDIGRILEADVLLISVRRRYLPKEQLDVVRQYIASGRPVVGIRTASHAFVLARGKSAAPGQTEWPNWDAEVTGGSYIGYYRTPSKVTISAASPGHPILEGVSLPFTSNYHLYRVTPLQSGAQSVAAGKVEENPPEPVAWTFRHIGKGRTFCTSLGGVDDFANPAFQRLLLNGIRWAAARD